ncbi:MAG: hypothetical protein K8R85_12460 [Bacteroidetes bacterium]|nr:hypothetical protein [Bacteroidota bacterium]
MKKLLNHLLLLTVGIVMISSCTSIYKSSPPFTSVDKIIQLKSDMDIRKVNEMLGIQPYDIYTIQETGGSLLVYNYRIRDRKVKLPVDLAKQDEFIHSEEFQTKGDTYYRTDAQRLFIFFQEGKMKSMLTDNGINNAEHLLIMNNTISYISKEEYNKVRMYRLGSSSNYLLKKDSTTVIVNLGAGETKSNPLSPISKNPNVGEAKKGGSPVGLLLTVAAVVALIFILK